MHIFLSLLQYMQNWESGAVLHNIKGAVFTQPLRVYSWFILYAISSIYGLKIVFSTRKRGSLRFKFMKLAKNYTLKIVGQKIIHNIICPIVVNRLEEVVAFSANGG